MKHLYRLFALLLTFVLLVTPVVSMPQWAAEPEPVHLEENAPETAGSQEEQAVTEVLRQIESESEGRSKEQPERLQHSTGQTVQEWEQFEGQGTEEQLMTEEQAIQTENQQELREIFSTPETLAGIGSAKVQNTALQTEEERKEKKEKETGRDDPDPVFGLRTGESRSFSFPVIEDGIPYYHSGQRDNVIILPDGQGAAAGKQLEQASVMKTVTVEVLGVYYYGEEDLGGSDGTHVFRVTCDGKSSMAYCLNPKKTSPSDGKHNYELARIEDSDALSKVLFYSEQYFKEKHPGYGKRKKYIITHLAAAFSSGDDHWAAGANDKGKAEAKALCQYAAGQADLPSGEIAFSPRTTSVHKENGFLRTDSVILTGQAGAQGQIATGEGVQLVNETDASRSGSGTVTVNCGDRFHLLRPLPCPADLSVTMTVQGNVQASSTAYKIKTRKEEQSLGIVFALPHSISKNDSMTVRFTSPVSVSVRKQDSQTSHPLQGAQFGLYSACEQTDGNGRNLKKDQQISIASSGADGVCTFDCQPSSGCDYYVREIVPPEYYALSKEVYLFTGEEGPADGSVRIFTHTFADEVLRGSLKLRKVDSDTKTDQPQGDASLEGGRFGLYAREDILNPDQSGRILYKKGEQAAEAVTGPDGTLEWKNLWPGRYYIKELAAPEGYVLDSRPRDADIIGTVLDLETTVEEQVVRQPFQLIKVSGGHGTDAAPLKGAGFKAWLVSSLRKNNDGLTYDFATAAPVKLSPDGGEELFTDERGYSVSVPLPYGLYLVKETTVPEDHSPVEDFYVKVSEDHPDQPQVWKVLLDEEFGAKLKIIKRDKDSGNTILKPGAEFKIFSLRDNAYVKQMTRYPKKKIHESYFTDETGTLILPENLRPGKYRIEEITPPEGYLPDAGENVVTIDSHVPVKVDELTGDLLVEAYIENQEVKGRLELLKKGPVLTGFEDGRFLYEVKGLAGAQFSVEAEEDIFYADGRRLKDGQKEAVLKKGEIAARLTTDEKGKALSEILPLGHYLVRETKAPYGCRLIDEPWSVELKSDKQSAVVTKTLEVQDPKQQVEVSVVKQTTEEGNRPLQGAEFSLYAEKPVCSREDATVLVPEDGLIGKAVSDEKGQVHFTDTLPHGEYYIRETAAPKGYDISPLKVECPVLYQDGRESVIKVGRTVRNHPLPGKGDGSSEGRPNSSRQLWGGSQISAPKTGDSTPAELFLTAAFSAFVIALVCLICLSTKWRKE